MPANECAVFGLAKAYIPVGRAANQDVIHAAVAIQVARAHDLPAGRQPRDADPRGNRAVVHLPVRNVTVGRAADQDVAGTIAVEVVTLRSGKVIINNNAGGGVCSDGGPRRGAG